MLRGMDLETFQNRMLDSLEAYVSDNPGADVEYLTQVARRDTRDARITDVKVEQQVDVSPLLVGRPDGAVVHLRHVLEGAVLTQRVRSPTAARGDLWTTLALAPFTMLALAGPLPLAAGGELRSSSFGHDALVGPVGWLPEVDAWELVALTLTDGAIHASRVDEADLGDLERQQQVREVIARHYRRERWFSGTDRLEDRPAEVVSAIALALLEEPRLFAQPPTTKNGGRY